MTSVDIVDPDGLIARLERLPAAVVSDVLRQIGRPHQVLHHAVARLSADGGTVAGPAFCVRGERRLGASSPDAPNLRHEMYRRMPAGSVVVVASGGYRDAVVFGENVALSLKVRACRAIVTDGGVRDREAMRTLGIPVYAGFVTPLSGGGEWTTRALDEPVALPGQSCAFVTVAPGDLVVGDADGVVIVPADLASRVVADAEHALEMERRTRLALIEGRDPEEAYAAFKRFPKPAR
jgi:regulator of RNase E activity RraA